MSTKAIITQSHLEDIANAIIAKDGGEAMTPAQMASRIENLPSGGEDPLPWTRPSDWPHIDEILASNAAAQPFAHKMIMLLPKYSQGPVISWNDYSVGTAYCITDESPTVATAITYVGRPEYTIPLNPTDSYRWVIFAWDGTFSASSTAKLSFALWAHCDNAKFVSLRESGGAGPRSPFLGASGLFDVSGTIYCSENTNCSFMFSGCSALRAVPDVLDVSNCTNCSSMFYNCSSLRAVPDVLDVSNCTNCSSMFYNCSALLGVPTLELSSNSASNFQGFFYFCINICSFPSLDLSRATSLYNCFAGLNSLISMGDVFDVSSCTSNVSVPASPSLLAIPTHITGIANQNWSPSVNISRDSVAVIEDGVVTGGLAKYIAIPEGSTATPTITLASNTKNKFTAEEQTLVGAAFASNGWTLAW